MNISSVWFINFYVRVLSCVFHKTISPTMLIIFFFFSSHLMCPGQNWMSTVFISKSTLYSLLMYFQCIEWSRHNVYSLTLSHMYTTNMQQTTSNVFCQNIENLFNWMDNLWRKVENIVTKGEIVRFVQFLLLSLCFQKAVRCRGVRKRLLYEGKG